MGLNLSPANATVPDVVTDANCSSTLGTASLVENGTYCQVMITSGGSFVIPNSVTSINYIVVGGGGGGGSSRGGGGGGGGVKSGAMSVSPGGSLSVAVGSGGGADSDGGASSLGGVSAGGGGAGGQFGVDGHSVSGSTVSGNGGGAGANYINAGVTHNAKGGSGTNKGGDSAGPGDNPRSSGGGGGAGAAGGTSNGGNGATVSLTGLPGGPFGGGGGGAEGRGDALSYPAGNECSYATAGPGTGGSGGGGAGARSAQDSSGITKCTQTGTSPTAGSASTGGGGGGGVNVAASGGSGVVYIAFPVTQITVTATATGVIYGSTYTMGIGADRMAQGDINLGLSATLHFDGQTNAGAQYSSSTQPTEAGTYNVTPSDLLVGGSPVKNYKVTYSQTTLIIARKSVSISIPSTTVTYTGAQAVLPTPVATGAVNNETVVSPSIKYDGINGTSYSSTEIPTAPGSYTISPYLATLSSNNSNYTIGYTNTTLTIQPAPATITGATISLAYTGTSASVPAPTLSGQKGNETIQSVTVTYTGINGTTYPATSTPPTVPGTYSVAPSAATLSSSDSYYTKTYVAGTLTITQAPLFITALTETLPYTGSPVVASVPQLSGQKNSETLSRSNVTLTYAGTGTTTYTASTTAPTAAGTYTVTPSAATISANDANYSKVYTFGVMTIGSAVVTVTGPSQTLPFTGSAAAVTNTTTISGVKNGETLTGVTLTYTGTGTTSYGPSATPPTAAGTYSVAPSAATLNNNDGNYTKSYVAGTLTISKAPVTLNAWYSTGISASYGDVDFNLVDPTNTNGLTGTWTYTSSNTSKVQITGNLVHVVAATTSAVTITGTFVPSDSNYATKTVTASMNISKATLVINWADKILYGENQLANGDTDGLPTWNALPNGTVVTASSVALSSNSNSVVITDGTNPSSSGTKLRYAFASTAATIFATITPTDTANVNVATPSIHVTPTASTPIFSQSPIFNALSAAYGDANIDLSLNYPTIADHSAGTWAFTSGQTSVAVIQNSHFIQIKGAGSATITGSYTPGSSVSSYFTTKVTTFVITVSQKTTTATLTGPATATVGVNATLRVDGSVASGYATFYDNGTAISGCTNVYSFSFAYVTCSTWKPTTGGTHTVTASWTPYDTGYAGSTSSASSVNVAAGTVTVSSGSFGPTTGGWGNADPTIAVPTMNTQGVWSFGTSTPSLVTVVNTNQLHFTGTGTAAITATYTPNNLTDYAVYTTSFNVSVSGASITVSNSSGNGGVKVDGVSASSVAYVAYNSNPVITFLPNTGYRLTALSVDSVSQGASQITAAESGGLSLSVGSTNHTVTFSFGLGTWNLIANPRCGAAPATQVGYTYRTSAAVPAAPLCAGLTFYGWNTAADGVSGSWYTAASLMPGNDVNLYASWLANPSGVGLSYQLGSGISGSIAGPARIQVVEGQTISLSSNATASGGDVGTTTYTLYSSGNGSSFAQVTSGSSATFGLGTLAYSANSTWYKITAVTSYNSTTSPTVTSAILQIAPARALSVTTTATIVAASTTSQLTGSNATASGGDGVYTWSLAPSSSALPNGVTLNSDGTFAGTPTTAGDFSNIVLRVTDGTGTSVNTSPFIVRAAAGTPTVSYGSDKTSSTYKGGGASGYFEAFNLTAVTAPPANYTGTITVSIDASHSTATTCTVDSTALTGNTVRAATSGACRILITVAADSNYAATSAYIDFTFNKAQLTYSGASGSITYGSSSNSIAAGSLTGYVGTDAAASSNSPTLTCTATGFTATTAVGTVLNNACSVSGSYYTITTNNLGTTTVTAQNLSAPSTVTLSPHSGSATSLDVTFNASANASSYVLNLYSSSSGGSPVASLTPSAAGTYTFSSLTVSTNYYVGVVAKGTGNFADSLESTPRASATTAKSSQTASAIGLASTSFTYSATSGAYQLAGTGGESTSTTYTFALDGGHTNTCSVTSGGALTTGNVSSAVCWIVVTKAGDTNYNATASNPIQLTITALVLSAPTITSAAATSGVAKSITVAWTAVSGATKYNVYLFDSNGAGPLASKLNVAATTAVFATSDYASMADATTYMVSVKAVADNANYSDASSESSKTSAATAAAPVLPTITVQPPTTASTTVNRPASLAVTATTSDGGTLSYQWYDSTNAPMSGNGATSATYAPTLGTAGSYTYYVSVKNTLNGLSTTTQSGNVVLTVNAAMSITTSSLAAGTYSTAYTSVTMAASGGTSPKTWSATGVPTGMSLSTTGVLSGTPTVTGTFSVVFTVTDAAGATATTTLSLLINRLRLATPNITASNTSGSLKSITTSWAAVANASYYTATLLYDYNSSQICTFNLAPGVLTAVFDASHGCASYSDGNNVRVNIVANPAAGDTNYTSSISAQQIMQTSFLQAPSLLTLTFGQGSSPLTVGKSGTSLTLNGAYSVYQPADSTYTVDVKFYFNGVEIAGSAQSRTYSGGLPGTGSVNTQGTASYVIPVLTSDSSVPGGTGTYSAVATVTAWGTTSAGTTSTVSLTVYPQFTVTAPATGTNLQKGVAWTWNLNVTGGHSPYTYSVSTGSIPSWLTLDTSTWTLSGTPTTIGTNMANFTMRIKDADNKYSVDVVVKLNVVAGPQTTLTVSVDHPTSAYTGTAYSQSELFTFANQRTGATASSITFAVDNRSTTTCSISTGSTLTRTISATGPGVCWIAVTDPGDVTNWASTTVYATVTFTPLALTVASAPTLTRQNGRGTSLAVNFAAVANADSYIVNVYDLSAGGTLVSTWTTFTPNGSNNVITGLTTGTSYAATLTAVGSGNYSNSAESAQSSGVAPQLTSQTITVASDLTSASYSAAGYTADITLSISGASGAGSVTYAVAGSGNTASSCQLVQNGAKYAVSATASGICGIVATIAADANYSSATSNMSFQFDKAIATVTASSPTVTYGDAAPTVTGSISGLVGADTSSVVSGLVCTTVYTTTSDAGSAPSTTCNGATATNYTFTYVPGSVLVQQAPVVITASSPTVTYGANAPPITPSYSGFKNSYTPTGSAIPTCSVSGYSNSAVSGSTFTTSCSGSTATNYSFSYVTGTLTVTSATQTISFNAPISATYGDSPITLTATSSSGLTVSITTSSAACSITNGSLTILGAGSCVITASQSGNSNFNSATDAVRTINVAPKQITITATLDGSPGNTTLPYASTAPVAGFTTSAMVGSDSVASVTFLFTGTGNYSSATAPTAVGSYTLTPSNALMGSGSASNYTFVYSTAVYGIVRRALPTPMAIPMVGSMPGAPFHYSTGGPGDYRIDIGVGAIPTNATKVVFRFYSGASGGTPTAAVEVTNAPADAVWDSQTANTHYYVTAQLIGDGQSYLDSGESPRVDITTAHLPDTMTVPASYANMTYGDADIPTGISLASGLTPTIAGSGACTVSNGNIHLISNGTCTISAWSSGDSVYGAVTPTVQRTFTVSKATLTVTAHVSVSSNTLPTTSVSATATASGLAYTDQFIGATLTYDDGHGHGGTSAPTNAGVYTVTPSAANINGRLDYYNVVYTATTYTLNPGASTTTLRQPSSAVYGSAITLNAGTSVAGTVSFDVGGQVICANAGSDGAYDATCNWTGAHAGTYTVTATFTPTNSNFASSSSTITVVVQAKSLTVSGLTANSKDYDGTTSATGSGTGALVGVISGDDVQLSGSPTFTFVTPGHGTGIGVGIGGYTLTGTAASDYLFGVTWVYADIRAAASNVTATWPTNVVYGSTATISATVDHPGVVTFKSGSTNICITAVSNVNNAVTCSWTPSSAADFNLSVELAVSNSNYQNATSSSTVTVSKKPVTISGLSAANKVYNGNTIATLSGTPVLGGVVSADSSNVSLVSSGASASFANATHGSGKAVTVAGYVLSGSAAGNYDLAQPSGLTADITLAASTLSFVSPSGSVYGTDVTYTFTANQPGTVAVTVDGAGSPLTPCAAVVVTANTAANCVWTPNFAGNHTVDVVFTPTSNDYSGASASASFNVAAKVLTISGVTAVSKAYDGNTSANLTGTPALVGVVGNDNVSLDATAAAATFASANKALGIAVSVTGYVLTGPAAANYSLQQPSTLTADITAAGSNIALTAPSGSVYGTSDTISFTTNLPGTVAVTVDSVSVCASVSVTANTAATCAWNPTAAGSHNITVAFTPTSGNYGNSSATATFNTAKKQLTITGIGVSSKSFDGTNSATITGTAVLNGVANSDAIVLGGTPVATFPSSSHGANQAVTVTGYSITGSAAGNYDLLQPSGLTASINAQATNTTLTVVTTSPTYGSSVQFSAAVDQPGTVDFKIGTTTLCAAVSATPLAAATCTWNPTAAGSFTVVAVLTPTSADFQGSQQTASLTVAQKVLTINGFTVDNKVYDGNAVAALSGSPALVGVVSGDSVTLGGNPVATFASAHKGNSQAVTVNGFTISGSSATNYSLQQPTGQAANITAAPTNVSMPAVTGAVYGTDVVFSVTASQAGTLSVTVDGVSVCSALTVSANVATTCTWTPDHAGTHVAVSTFTPATTNYTGSSATVTFSVAAKALTVTAVVTPSSQAYGSSTPAASYSVAGLVGSDTITAVTFTFSGTNSSTAPTAVGTYTLTPSAAVFGAGSASDYQIAYSGASYHVTNGSVTLSLSSSSGNTGTYNTAITFNATASQAGAVTFSVGGTALCSSVATVSGSATCSWTPSAPGTYSVTASIVPTDAGYSTANATALSILVSKASQTITFTGITSKTWGDAAITLAPTSTSSLPVTVASNSPAVCSVQLNVVSIIHIGICSLTATQSGDSNYFAATGVLQTFTVNPLPLIWATAPVVSVTAGERKTIHATWTLDSNATGYVVRLYDQGGGLLRTFAAVTTSGLTIMASNYSALADNGNYKVSVQKIAVADATDSAESTPQDVRVNAISTITYLANGATSGSAPASQTFVEGGSPIQISTNSGTLAQTGYTFLGWNTSSAGTGTDYAATGTVTYSTLTNLSLYAKWSADALTVTFNPNFGAGSSVSQGVTAGTAAALNANSFVRTGYIFNGWATSSNGSVVYTDGQQITTVVPLVLYAKWTAIVYNVTYLLNGATGSAPTEPGHIIGDTFTLANNTSFSRTGYDFGGWTDGTVDSLSGATITVGSADLVYTAIWNVQHYTITYNLNGATSGAASRTSDDFIYGSPAISLPTLGTMVLAGYSFAGWSTTGNLPVISGNFAPTGSVTLRAVWTPNTYTVTYNPNGASGAASMASASYTTGGNPVTLATAGTLVKPGHTFAGWSLTANGSVLTGTFTTASDVTLYAIWTPIQYHVTYDLASGTSAVPTEPNHIIGDRFNLAAAPTRANYDFLGWNDGTSTFQAGYSYLVAAQDVTLTAVWIRVFDVAYNFNGSPDSPPAVNRQQDGAVISSVAAPNKFGYTFGGWVTQRPTNVAAGSNFTVSAQDYILSAVWNPVSYTVTYFSLGDTNLPTEANHVIGDTFTVGSALQRTGFIFMGWSDGSQTYGPGATYTVGSSNITFTAVFFGIPKTITYDLAAGTSAVPVQPTKFYGQTFTVASAPTRYGYTFVKWNDGTTDYAPGSTYTMGLNNEVLTAVWTITSNAITYSLGAAPGTAPSPTTATLGSNLTLPAEPIWATHDFLGWSDGTSSYPAGSTIVAGGSPATFTAQWASTLYHVTFAAGGASGTAPTQSPLFAGISFTIPGSGSLAQAGYTFSGWSDGTTTHQAGEVLVMPASNLALTALWTLIPVIVPPAPSAPSTSGSAGPVPVVPAAQIDVSQVPTTLIYGSSVQRLQAVSPLGSPLTWSTTSPNCSVTADGAVSVLRAGPCELTVVDTAAANLSRSVVIQVEPRLDLKLTEITNLTTHSATISAVVAWPGTDFTVKFCITTSELSDTCVATSTIAISNESASSVNTSGALTLARDIDGLQPGQTYFVHAAVMAYNKKYAATATTLVTPADKQPYFTVLTSKSTKIDWSSIASVASAKVLFGGQVICESALASCVAPKLYGPSSKLQLVVTFKNGQTGLPTNISYVKSAKPVSINNLSFAGGAMTVSRMQAARIQVTLQLAKSLGFTQVLSGTRYLASSANLKEATRARNLFLYLTRAAKPYGLTVVSAPRLRVRNTGAADVNARKRTLQISVN